MDKSKTIEHREALITEIEKYMQEKESNLGVGWDIKNC